MNIAVENALQRYHYQQAEMVATNANLKAALKIALEEDGTDKLRMLCWLVMGAQWTEALSVATPRCWFELPPHKES